MLAFTLILALIATALILFWQAGRQQRQAGLPGGRIIYSDTRAWSEVQKPLYDPSTELTGKPDYLIEQNGQIIPVEVKSGRAPAAPYDSHIYQIAAYCFLVQKTYRKRPPFGIIHYKERDFAVDYTPELELALMDVLDDMRRDEHRSDVPRSHEQAARCARCGFRSLCDQSLVS